jgi:hypothetical protein
LKLSLHNRRVLADIPSASGIELIADIIFILSDDSPWLFKLNNKLDIVEKIQLTDPVPTFGNIISKELKLDLEAITSIGCDAHNELLIFGSGSKSPKRDVLLRVTTTPPHIIKKYSLVDFYENLRHTTGLSKVEMNIEAALVIRDELYLFNRGRNIIIRLNVNEFLSYTEGTGAIPTIKFFRLSLPSINGIEAGFSGATSTPDSNQIIFTASIENTTNWIDDGEILGSFVGILPLTALTNLFAPTCVVITDEKNNILKIKTESIVVHHQVRANCFKLLLVTDNDEGVSELIEMQLSF